MNIETAPVVVEEVVAANAPTAKAKKEPKVKVEKAPRDSQNGVTRPAAGTTTAKVWDVADSISNEKDEAAARKDVLNACNALGINPATTTTQYGHWRKYNGIAPAVRVIAPVVEAPVAAVETNDGEQVVAEAPVAVVKASKKK